MRDPSSKYADPFGWEGSSADPWQFNVGNVWASHDPIPMGYRDQSHSVHGPYALDYYQIRQKWFDLDGEPGSPLGNDYTGTVVGQDIDDTALLERIQSFEHGIIVYDSTSGTYYYPYTETYLPDIRAHESTSGWNSTMTVRNNHTSSPATVSISLYTDDGRVLDSRTYVGLPRRATWTFSVREALLEFLNQPEYVGVFHGSAIVHANQDVSVTVMHIHQSSPYATGSYTGLTASGPMLYFPLLQRANNSMYSDLTLFNPGTTSAQVQVQYIPEKAPYWGCTATSISIPANGSRNFNSRDGTLGCTLSSPFVGGATVTSNQPLVGVANQWRDVGPDGSIEAFMSYEAFPAGGTSGFMPILQRNNNNWYTSSTLLDTSEGSETATLYYYSEDNGVSCGSYPTSLGSNDVVVVFPSPPGGVCGDTTTKFVGAGRAFRNLALAMVVNQEELSTGNQKMSYSAVGGGTGTVIVPWVMKNHDNWQGRNDWYTGLNVQNLGTGPATVTVTYYNSDGSAGPAPDTVAALPARTNHVFLPAPSGGWTFSGSAVVTANQPIAVVVNHFAASGADDTFMSHTGLNR